MTWRNRLRAVREEMEKDGLDLIEQVTVLILGGMLGGQALSITQQEFPLFIQGGLFLMLLLLGIIVIGVIHFIVSYHRVLASE